MEKWDILANFQTLCTCAWLSALLLCSTFSKNNCATTHKMQNRSLIWVPNSSVTDFFYSCSYALACLCQVKMLSDISPNIKKVWGEKTNLQSNKKCKSWKGILVNLSLCLLTFQSIAVSRILYSNSSSFFRHYFFNVSKSVEVKWSSESLGQESLSWAQTESS